MSQIPPTQTIQQNMLKQPNNSLDEGEIMADFLDNSERSLHRVSSSLGSYQATPITKHYSLNNQILMAFESHYERRLYKVAYAIGLQFVETALLEIPKHGYFYSTRHESERIRSSLEALRVTQMLREIQEKEGNFIPAETTRIQKLAMLAEEQAKQPSLEDYENDRAKVEAELRSTTGNNSFPDFCGQFMIFDEICPSVGREGSQSQSMKEIPPAPATLLRNYQRGEPSRMIPTLHEGHALAYFPDSLRSVSYPTISPPPFSRTTSDLDLARALYLSGLEVVQRRSAEEQVESFANYDESLNKSDISRIDIATLSELYREDFDSLIETGRVRISRVATFQGRTPGSVNGCTVIAPLLCIHHFHDQDVIPDPGLPDSVIIQVIDQETPEILGELRRSLGLTKDAFIIPSDAHDYLIGRQLLAQEQFVNVCGGNILDEEHLNSFVQVLATADSSTDSKLKDKKIACTLFFHEHVVAIYKLDRGKGPAWYDIIDSLPLQKTLRLSRKVEEIREGPPNNPDLFDLYGTDVYPINSWDEEILPNTVRIRCLDLEALKAALRWYACSKFNKENLTYIDMYPWNDMNTDFDPRVFQIFVWREA